jgi:hypothetical protein
MNRRLLIGLSFLSLLAPASFACSSGSGRNPGSPGQGGSTSMTGTGGTSGGPGTGGSTSMTGTGGSGTGTGGSATGTGGSSSGTGGAASGTGGSGGGAAGAAGGSLGTGGGGGSTGIAGGAGAPPADTGASVLERNKNPSRDGAFVQPTLTKAKAAGMVFDANFMATFNGGMWASPIYMADGPNGKGAFFAVTTSNMVYALDETTGATIWMHSIGMASQSTGANCGEGPIGISGTPVIDAKTRTLYVAGGIGTNGVMRHEVHALNIDDGMEKTTPAGWPVLVNGMQSGGTSFTANVENQRGSLSLVNGILYVPYGGYNGDCGGYHGWVIAIDTTNPSKTGAWATGGQGEAIWAAGGMASDGTNIFATTGNGRSAAHLDSEEIVRLTGLATVDTTTGRFWATDYQQMDSNDADLGASSPVYFELPGATPSTLVAAVAKNGSFYVVNSKSLGGAGGAVITMKATNSASNGPNSVRTAMISYQTTKGRYVAFQGGAPICPAGGGGGTIMSILMKPGAPPTATTAFCAPGNTSASPISTSTDGTNETVLWYIAGGKLIGADGDTGAMIYGGGTGSCSNVRRWTSPIAVKGRIVVGGDGHLCSWSAPP